MADDVNDWDDELVEQMENLLRSQGLAENRMSNAMRRLRHTSQQRDRGRPDDERTFTVNGSIDKNSRGKERFRWIDKSPTRSCTQRYATKDMLSLLVQSTQHLPVADLHYAVHWSFKRAGRTPYCKVPHEYYYQSQLVSIIRAWLPDTWLFFPEVGKDVDRQRIDSVVESVVGVKSVALCWNWRQHRRTRSWRSTTPALRIMDGWYAQIMCGLCIFAQWNWSLRLSQNLKEVSMYSILSMRKRIMTWCGQRFIMGLTRAKYNN